MLHRWFLNDGRNTIRDDYFCFKVVIIHTFVYDCVSPQISDLSDVIIELLYRMIFWKFDTDLDGVLLVDGVDGHATLFACLHRDDDAG